MRESRLPRAIVVALGLVLLLTLTGCEVRPVQTEAPWGILDLPDNCYEGTQASGSLYLICMPGDHDPSWNGELVLYAHGYVSPDEPIGIPEDQMYVEGPFGPVYLPDFANIQGYAFATTSYPTNGLAVLPAITDLVDLVDIFAAHEAPPQRVLLAGVSEGGLITTLAVERHPAVFDGGLALCGPYGSFREQVNYFGDFRVVFDYFFPGLVPGDPVNIPPELKENWDTHYANLIEEAVTDADKAHLVTQLLTVTGASPLAFDPPDSTEAILRLIWYNVFATEDAKQKLGGQPYDNMTRIYSGSGDDAALNADVVRIAADQVALDEMEAHYRTTGALARPLVTLHETGDFIVPYWHAPMYEDKVVAAGRSAFYRHLVSDTHGHCEFGAFDVLLAFQALQEMLLDYTYLPIVTQLP